MKILMIQFIENFKIQIYQYFTQPARWPDAIRPTSTKTMAPSFLYVQKGNIIQFMKLSLDLQNCYSNEVE